MFQGRGFAATPPVGCLWVVAARDAPGRSGRSRALLGERPIPKVRLSLRVSPIEGSKFEV